MSFWATTYMADEESEEFGGSGSADEVLQDHIAHWMEVLDRWVKRIDSGLGTQDGGVSTPEGPDDGENALPQMDDGVDFEKGVQG